MVQSWLCRNTTAGLLCQYSTWPWAQLFPLPSYVSSKVRNIHLVMLHSLLVPLAIMGIPLEAAQSGIVYIKPD